ncbi:MAG TPA: type II toxin-antitoxin system ParD family antitoxin [Acetobacteraceae bacterium]|jgi:antitoxin ParD1/3/4
MKVSLTPELERRIAEKVRGGLYTSASEVVRDGLRLLFGTDALQERQLARLRADIQVGLEQAENGELPDGAASRARVMAAISEASGTRQ